METRDLFQAALGLTPPWLVLGVTFEPVEEGEARRLEILVDFPAGSRFPCAQCGKLCAAHDTTERKWRHLNFFQHHTYLRARVPRTKCEEHGVLAVEVPWAREGSGFTLLFEAYLMMMAPEMPMAAIARQLEEHDTRLWRVVQAHVEQARATTDMSSVRAVMVDETSRARGQSYVTLFAEPGEKDEKDRVLFVADGRKHETFHEFGRELRAHGSEPARVRDVCMDMSEAFLKGATEEMPSARVTLDHYHVSGLVSKAQDEVRRRERTERPELKKTRYLWLKNPGNLSARQQEELATLSKRHLLTAVAYRMRLNLKKLWEQETVVEARAFLERWCRWVTRASYRRDPRARAVLEPMAKVAGTLREKKENILNYFRYARHLTNGVLEGINGLVQAARARARGYRNPETFKTMIYLVAGRLQFNLPTATH
jgi:transposase